MELLRKWFTISQLVTLGPMVLLLILSVVLGVSRYIGTYEMEIESIVREARSGAQPIVNLMKPSVGGANYANVQDESALSLYHANKSLLFFRVTGKSDQGGEGYGVAYDKSQSAVMRTVYDAEAIAEIKSKLERIDQALADPAQDPERRAMMERMKAEQSAELAVYQRDSARLKDLDKAYPRPAPSEFDNGVYLDEATWRLHLLLPTGNPGGGEIWMVLDASVIGELGGHILATTLPLNLATLALCVLLAWALSRVIIRPIREMVSTIHRIEQDSDLTLRLTDQGKDELSQISATLNEMLDKFQGLLSAVKDSASGVSGAALQMSSTLSESANGIEQQKLQTSLLTTAATEMASTVQQVARNAEQASAAAENASNEAVSGRREVETTINLIDNLAGEVENAAGVIDRLNDQSRDIGKVVDVIKGIAEQTNLLALNAAIEAARAGEQGRGFAVVADEVRTLASRTRDSTTEIEQMIEQLQGGTHAAVNAMLKGREMARSCVNQAQRAGTALQSITEAVDTITQMNVQIASAAEQQSTVTDEIHHNIVKISDIADRNAGSAIHCGDTSRHMVALAGDLGSKVGRFRII